MMYTNNGDIQLICELSDCSELSFDSLKILFSLRFSNYMKSINNNAFELKNFSLVAERNDNELVLRGMSLLLDRLDVKNNLVLGS